MGVGGVSEEVDADVLRVEVEGWEGPFDLLLDLARRQKVDLRRISVLDLVEQYVSYVMRAEALRLELAADYLVTAAWLAYLKSALLLPRDEQEEPPPEEVAMRLQLRLARLAAMREAGARLMARDRLGRDVFARGAPEGLRVGKAARWQCDLYGLLAGYGAVKARSVPVVHMVRARAVVTLESALAMVAARLAAGGGWFELDALLAGMEAGLRRSALASGFVAALELARQGKAELVQDGAFAPLRLRGVLA